MIIGVYVWGKVLNVFSEHVWGQIMAMRQFCENLWVKCWSYTDIIKQI